MISLLPLQSAQAGLTLREVLQVARQANPDLLALQAQAETSRLQAETEFYLPPLQFGIGTMGLQGPLAPGGHMQTSYQLSQQIPFPTKVARKKEAASQEAAAVQASAQSRELALELEVRNAYLDYWKAQRMQSFLNERTSVLAAHARRLKAGSLSTQLMQAHLVAAGSDLELIQNDLETARQQEASAQAELNAFMGRDPFAPLLPAEEPPLSPLPPSPTPRLADQVGSFHPQVLEAKSALQAAEARVSASKAEYFPDLNLSLRRNQNTPMAADASNTEVSVGLSLPFLYFWQPRATLRAAQAKQFEAEAQVRAKQNGIRLLLVRRFAELSSFRSQYLRFKNSILTESDRRMRIAHATAPTDMESLNEHRDALESSVELQIKALSVRVDFEKALAAYESLVGMNGSIAK